MPTSFANRHRRPSDPPITVFDIMPNDGVDMPHMTKVLNVSTPGTVRVTMLDESITDLTVTAGYAFPVCARRVWQTCTSATGLRGLV